MTNSDKKDVNVNVLERNINALLQRKKDAVFKSTRWEKAIDSITVFAGSMWSIYFHVVLYGGWLAWNTGWLGFKPFDPELIDFAWFAGVEAIFLTTFVLVGQNRINKQADKWAELDLHISLLTEHEITRMMTLVMAIAKKMDIQEANDEEVEGLSKEIHPGKVLDVMEKANE